jgi:hypothetical protein
MSVPRGALALSLAMGVVAACTERGPSGLDDAQLPEPPVTITLQLSWAEFGSNLQVFGGYGRVDDMSVTTVAKAYGGMDARTLVSFEQFPTGTQVRDSSNNLVTDTALTYIDAYVVVRFDTLASTNTDTVNLTFHETVESWDAQSASWTHAFNVPGAQRTWSVPGGGATLPIRSFTWNRSAGRDSAQFFLDSAQIRRWRTGPDSVRSGRLDLDSDGHRLKVSFAALRLVATSAFDPDTIIELTVPTTRATFIYDPVAAPPADGFRIGGAPAWRTVLDIALPSVLNGPQELCDAAGCPFALAPTNVTYAAIGLRTRRPPDAFAPTDTITVDARAVLSPTALPKSPLGVSVVGVNGSTFAPALFGPQEGSLVDVPITAFVQSVLRGPDEAGRPPSTTLAILSLPEPGTFSFAEFFGPGSGVNEPVLKLVITASPPVELP